MNSFRASIELCTLGPKNRICLLSLDDLHGLIHMILFIFLFACNTVLVTLRNIFTLSWVLLQRSYT